MMSFTDHSDRMAATIVATAVTIVAAEAAQYGLYTLPHASVQIGTQMDNEASLDY